MYDPATGNVVNAEAVIPAAGAVTKSMRGESSGVAEDHSVEAWLDHQTVPWPILPSDRLDYLGKRWKIIDINPTYSGDVVYASKITARAE